MLKPISPWSPLASIGLKLSLTDVGVPISPQKLSTLSMRDLVRNVVQPSDSWDGTEVGETLYSPLGPKHEKDRREISRAL